MNIVEVHPTRVTLNIVEVHPTISLDSEMIRGNSRLAKFELNSGIEKEREKESSKLL